MESGFGQTDVFMTQPFRCFFICFFWIGNDESWMHHNQTIIKFMITHDATWGVSTHSKPVDFVVQVCLHQFIHIFIDRFIWQLVIDEGIDATWCTLSWAGDSKNKVDSSNLQVLGRFQGASIIRTSYSKFVVFLFSLVKSELFLLVPPTWSLCRSIAEGVSG